MSFSLSPYLSPSSVSLATSYIQGAGGQPTTIKSEEFAPNLSGADGEPNSNTSSGKGESNWEPDTGFDGAQHTEPECANEGYSPDCSSEVPPGAVPNFDLSTVTYTNVFGRDLNIEGCLKISNEELLGLSVSWAPSSNAIHSQSAPTSSSSTPLSAEFDSPVMLSTAQFPLNDAPQPGPPSIPGGQIASHVGTVHPSTVAHSRPSPFNYARSPEAPVASSSRQTLTDIQPGQGELYRGHAQAAQHHMLDFAFPDGPPERRQQRSKDNRQQPYNKEKKGTRRNQGSSLAISHPIPSSTTPSDDDIAKAKASFRTLQAVLCPLLVEGQACGQLIDSAESMLVHLQRTHNVQPDKRKSANSALEGRCPLCDSQMDGGSIHRHLWTGHLYRYVCPVEGCHEGFTRAYQLRAHCKAHGFTMSGNEDFAVRK